MSYDTSNKSRQGWRSGHSRLFDKEITRFGPNTALKIDADSLLDIS